jgi:hypothetical protein
MEPAAILARSGSQTIVLGHYEFKFSSIIPRSTQKIAATILDILKCSANRRRVIRDQQLWVHYSSQHGTI